MRISEERNGCYYENRTKKERTREKVREKEEGREGRER